MLTGIDSLLLTMRCTISLILHSAVTAALNELNDGAQLDGGDVAGVKVGKIRLE